MQRLDARRTDIWPGDEEKKNRSPEKGCNETNAGNARDRRAAEKTNRTGGGHPSMQDKVTCRGWIMRGEVDVN